MEEVTLIKYKCKYCGDLIDSKEQCLQHESRHARTNKANKMLKDGHTLQEIQDACNIWYRVPEHLKNVTKDNCFTIYSWQSCDKPAYQIDHIYMNGKVKVGGFGLWDGYHGRPLYLNSNHLKDPHSKAELFIAKQIRPM